jgi:hypothetical protein
MAIKRTDTHRPSVINPDEYEFVANECIKMEGFGDAAIILREREVFRVHKDRTGGTYAGHEHGGNCMVCGSVNAVYTNLFYHEATNAYVRVGTDCTEKLWHGDFGMGRFRKGVENVREFQKGKQKAAALLGDRGLSRCWDLHLAEWNEDKPFQWEERTIRDIVGKLVKYGSISDKQYAFLDGLLGKIDGRADREAKQAIEKAAAKDAPTGKQEVEVEVVSIKVQEGYYGDVTKMLIKHADGWKAWGTRPAGNAEIGDTIKLAASFEPSRDDAKFAFFKRPRLRAATI